jgi:hypothetical protein
LTPSNTSPWNQPGILCPWIPNQAGDAIENVKDFPNCRYVAWLHYYIDNFISRWDYELNGTMKWRGEDDLDEGQIIVSNNEISLAFLHNTDYRNIMPEILERQLEQKNSAVGFRYRYFKNV